MVNNMLKKDYFNEELDILLTSYIDNDSQIWFKAKEVAEILGYKKPDDAIKRHVSELHKKKILENQHGTNNCSMTYFIDEPGFYEISLRSKLPKAKTFREWVCAKVLPSIRKYGHYSKFDSRFDRRVVIDDKKYYKHPIFSNYAAHKDGTILNVKKEKVRKMSTNNRGYLFFSLYDKRFDKPKIYYQHRFVYEVFQGPITKWFEIDHINNNKTDNRIENLQLVTHKENIDKKYHF